MAFSWDRFGQQTVDLVRDIAGFFGASELVDMVSDAVESARGVDTTKERETAVRQITDVVNKALSKANNMDDPKISELYSRYEALLNTASSTYPRTIGTSKRKLIEGKNRLLKEAETAKAEAERREKNLNQKRNQLIDTANQYQNLAMNKVSEFDLASDATKQFNSNRNKLNEAVNNQLKNDLDRLTSN